MRLSLWILPFLLFTFSASADFSGIIPQDCVLLGGTPDDVLQEALGSLLDEDSDLPIRQECVKWAVTNGAAVNGRLLISAIEIEDVVSAQVLLQNGADPNAVDESGLSALSRAAIGGQDAIADLLIAAGAKLDSSDRTLAGPLLFAVDRDDAHIVRALLDHGADVSAIYDMQTDEDGLETPMDSSTDEGIVLKQVDQYRKSAGNDPDAKLIADGEVEQAQRDRSPHALSINGQAKLRSFDAILADQAQIYSWLKSAGAKCATSQCGGEIADPIPGDDSP